MKSMFSSERKLVTPFARRFTKSVMAGLTDSSSLRRAKLSTMMEAIAGKVALRFVALQPRSLLKSFSISKENRNSKHYNIASLLVGKVRA